MIYVKTEELRNKCKWGLFALLGGDPSPLGPDSGGGMSEHSPANISLSGPLPKPRFWSTNVQEVNTFPHIASPRACV